MSQDFPESSAGRPVGAKQAAGARPEAARASQVPQLFDPVKAALSARRARRIGAATFLLDRAAEDLADRLALILRDFSAPLDVGTPLARFGAVVDQRWPRPVGSAGPQSPATALPAGAAAARRPSDAGLAQAAFDLIVSGMVFHAIDDLPGLLIQIRQALKPDGLMIAAFPGGETLNELRAVLMAAESDIRGAAGLRVFPMIDVRAAGQLLQRAGFALPVADSEKITVRYPDLFALIRDLRAMAATALPLIRPCQPGLTRAIILRAAELYAERFADADGRIRATFEMIWISGWSPHASQPAPLKPGSAKARLADALKAISAKS